MAQWLADAVLQLKGAKRVRNVPSELPTSRPFGKVDVFYVKFFFLRLRHNLVWVISAPYNASVLGLT